MHITMTPMLHSPSQTSAAPPADEITKCDIRHEIRCRAEGSEVGDARRSPGRAGTGDRAGVAHLAACALTLR